VQGVFIRLISRCRAPSHKRAALVKGQNEMLFNSCHAWLRLQQSRLADWISEISCLTALCYNPASEETTLANFSGIVKQLSKERDRLHQQLSGLNAALKAFAGLYRANNGIVPRRKMSAKGRARIAAAQRARWAKARGVAEVPKKRTMSVSARRKVATSQRARWAKVKGGKKAS